MMMPSLFFFFFFNDTATTEIYTLSLHDALPIWHRAFSPSRGGAARVYWAQAREGANLMLVGRSEEHTSELQSRPHLVCRLLLEKKKKQDPASNVAPRRSPSTGLWAPS